LKNLSIFAQLSIQQLKAVLISHVIMPLRVRYNLDNGSRAFISIKPKLYNSCSLAFYTC